MLGNKESFTSEHLRFDVVLLIVIQNRDIMLFLSPGAPRPSAPNHGYEASSRYVRQTWVLADPLEDLRLVDDWLWDGSSPACRRLWV